MVGMVVVGWREGVGGYLAVVDGRWSWWFGRLGMEAGVFFQEYGFDEVCSGWRGAETSLEVLRCSGDDG